MEEEAPCRGIEGLAGDGSAPHVRAESAPRADGESRRDAAIAWRTVRREGFHKGSIGRFGGRNQGVLPGKVASADGGQSAHKGVKWAPPGKKVEKNRVKVAMKRRNCLCRPDKSGYTRHI